MKNLAAHYIILFFPLFVLVSLNLNFSLDSTLFTSILLIYALFFQPLMNARRLHQKNNITKHEIAKFLIPGHSRQYWKEIYWTW